MVSASNVTTLSFDGTWEEYRDSYINAISILNNASKTSTGISTARSIAIEDIEKLAIIDKGDVYGTSHTYTHGDMVDANGNKVIASATNKVTLKYTYYEDTIEENIKSLANGKYYLASTCIGHSSWPQPMYYVRMMLDGKVSAYLLFYPWGYSSRRNYYGVRAIVYI